MWPAANDIDYALLEPSPLFEDCVEDVGKRYRLPPFWMHRLERFTYAPRFRENFYRHADVLHLNAESGNLSVLVQDSDWQLANKLCWFRRYRKNDGRDIAGILQERDGDAARQVSQSVRAVFGEEVTLNSDGTMLSDALERGGIIMRSCIRTAWLTVVLMFAMVATALANYPGTLDGGNLVLVDGGMGVGYYADRSSVQVEQYAPPKYQLAVNVVGVEFSDEYWRSHETYIGGPYTKGESFTLTFRYNWDRKVISYQRGKTWLDWDVNRDYSHAEGDPMIPFAAEVAFVSAYNMRFFNDKLGYSPVLKKYQRVIDEQLYRRLGI